MARRRRIFRRTIDVVCVVGILLLAALWVSNIWNQYYFELGIGDQHIHAQSLHGFLAVGTWQVNDYTDIPRCNVHKHYWINSWGGKMLSHNSAPFVNVPSSKFYWAWAKGKGRLEVTKLGCPIWLPILLLSILPPLLHLFAYIRHRLSLARIPKGHVLCLDCGYDLFGSSGNSCPECGKVI